MAVGDFGHDEPHRQVRVGALGQEAGQMTYFIEQAPLVAQQDLLSGVGKIEIHHGRLVFIEKIQGLGFDPKKMLLGILGGSYENDQKKDVIFSYAHEKGERVTGKTQFWMSVEDMVAVAKRCGSLMGESPEDLQQEVMIYLSSKTLSPENRVENSLRVADDLVNLLKQPLDI